MAQDPKAEAAAGEAPKKSSKKLIIIIAAVVALAAGGGGAAFFLMKGKSDGNHKEEVKEEHPPADPVFVKLETFTLNLSPEDGEKYLQVDITLNAESQADADAITKNMPLVRNRVVMILTSKKPSEISSPEGKDALSKELTASLNTPFTEKGKPQKLLGVLFTSFVIQ